METYPGDPIAKTLASDFEITVTRAEEYSELGLRKFYDGEATSEGESESEDEDESKRFLEFFSTY